MSVPLATVNACTGHGGCLACLGKTYRNRPAELIGDCLVTAIDHKLDEIRQQVANMREEFQQ